MADRYIDRKYALVMLDIAEREGVQNISIDKVRDFLKALPQDGRVWFETGNEIPEILGSGSTYSNQKTFATANDAFASLKSGADYLTIHTIVNNKHRRTQYDELQNSFPFSTEELNQSFDNDQDNPFRVSETSFMDCNNLDAIVEVDSAPVIHGRWITPHWRNSDCCCNCSVCDGEAIHTEYEWQKKGIYPICPYCGAKMDGKEQD